MKNKIKINLDDLKVQSFVTSIDSEKNQRILGGNENHPTHTQVTKDKEHVCTGQQCR